MDPRIRIHTKMSWIRNTGFWHYYRYLVELLVAVHVYLPAAGVAPDGPGLRVHHQAVRLVAENIKLKPVFRTVLRIRDVYPGSWFLPIPDPGSRISDTGSRIQKQQQKRGVKKIVVKPFFVATNFTKFKIILFFECWRKKFGPVFKEL